MTPPVTPPVSQRLVVLSVGSDHHPFPRLVDWIDDWLDRQPVDRYRYVAQHGTAPAPRHGEAHALLPHDQLQSLIAAADVVVMQGGPMGIVEAQRAGRKPIVVPRLAALGEVVDDHQIAFCRLLAGEGSVLLAESAEELAASLDTVDADVEQARLVPPRVDNAAAAADRLREVVDGLAPRRRLLRRARTR